jgi:hypothetical protein
MRFIKFEFLIPNWFKNYVFFYSNFDGDLQIRILFLRISTELVPRYIDSKAAEYRDFEIAIFGSGIRLIFKGKSYDR